MTTTTAAVLVPEQLSQAIQSAADPPSRCGGRPYAQDRAALASIIKQLHTGIPLRLLPPASLACQPGHLLAAAAHWQRRVTVRRMADQSYK